MNILSCLHVQQTAGMDRGVFTSAPIPAGTVIETSPVVVMSDQDRVLLDQTPLHDYIFEWGEEGGQCCMALGYIAVYNHSFEANCEYEMDYESRCISIRCVRTIEAGEELFVNYNGDWNNATELWFKAK